MSVAANGRAESQNDKVRSEGGKNCTKAHRNNQREVRRYQPLSAR
jgi:hypothetical protein